jgi:hypothetical protein
MTAHGFPTLDAQAIGATRDALHAYTQVLGAWLQACRPRRKHWWHLSLQPSIRGLTTGMVHAGIDFDMELDLQRNRVRVQLGGGQELSETLNGQSAAELADRIRRFLLANGVRSDLASAMSQHAASADAPPGYSPAVAATLGHAWVAVSAALAAFRAGIPEETSPIQLWPHHFDLSMLWLPGEKIRGQDPADEEASDKQMNFGFTFGDAGIPEPYFYVTAYPQPEAFPSLTLPGGTNWRTENFSGAVLLYRSLLEQTDPNDYLVGLWKGLLSAGRTHMLSRP